MPKTTKAKKQIKKSQNQDAQDEQGKPKLHDSDIVEAIAEFAILFRDQNNDPFIAPNGDGTKIYRIGGRNRDFRAWLGSFIRNRFHVVFSTGRIDNIAQSLESIALDTECSNQYPLELRMVWRDKNNNTDPELYYDLGKSMVRITPKGWFIVARPGIMFRRFSQQLPQVVPRDGGNILELAKYINLSDRNDILLFLVFAISAFIPGYPRPLCLLYGTQGAGKSTPGRLLKRLIDPTSVEGTVLPTNYEDFVRTANHHALLVFDNLSSIKPNISDALARIATGDTFSKRALYTDDDDIVYRLQRPVMLNGINQVITQSDLLDRSILLEMHRIDKAKMRTEKDFWADFDEQKPLILGAIFDTISKAMAKFPEIHLKELPRMADFAKWGYAIADSIDGYTGEDFLLAYSANIAKQHEQAIESSPVGTAVYLFMTRDDEAKNGWKGTATQLMDKLENYHFNDPETNLAKDLRTLTNGNLWPKDSSWFMRRLNYVLPDLESQGIHIETYCKKNQRIIKIKNLNYLKEHPEIIPFYQTELVKKPKKHFDPC